MLFYSLFPQENLCIFSAAGKLTFEEMRICHQELATEPDWPTIQTIVTDLRGCYDVDITFTDNHQRRRMEHNAFGLRRMYWLTGSSTVLGKLAMAANDIMDSSHEPNVFLNKNEMSRALGKKSAGIMMCLNDLD